MGSGMTGLGDLPGGAFKSDAYACSADGDGYVADRFRERLPKADIGKSCVRFKRLADLDETALVELIAACETTPAAGEISG